MGGQHMKNLSQSYKIMKAEEVLKLAEDKLIKVLSGETKVNEKIVIQVALELYKRRIPSKVEQMNEGNQLTIIKIVKNHTPTNSGETIDITPLERAAEKVISEKTRLLNEKLQKTRKTFGGENKTLQGDALGEHDSRPSV